MVARQEDQARLESRTALSPQRRSKANRFLDHRDGLFGLVGIASVGELLVRHKEERDHDKDAEDCSDHVAAAFRISRRLAPQRGALVGRWGVTKGSRWSASPAS